MNKGSIQLDQRGYITGVSSFVWTALNLNPNIIIGSKIQSYIDGLSSSWETINKGTLISHPYEFNNDKKKFLSTVFLCL